MSGPRFAGRRSDDLRYTANHHLPLRISGRVCAPRVAADADRPPRTARSCRGPRHRACADRTARRARFLRQPDDLDRTRSAARYVECSGRGAGRGQARCGAGSDPPPWEAIREAAFASTDLSPNSPAHYLFPSRQVSLDPEIRAYAADSFSAGRPVLDAAVDLMRRIKADFVYEIGATTASTTPPMSFALRRGVCQDSPRS